MINLVWHMGLGDAIACAAIAVKLSLKDEVTVPCWTKNEESVRSLFVNHPNIKVLPMDNDCWIQDKSAIRSRRDPKTVLLGVYNREDKQRPDEDFVQCFYRQAGMDISEKEKYCPIKEVSNLFPYERVNKEDLIFIHSDISRGFDICPPEYFLEGDKHGKYRYINTLCNYEKSILRYSGHLLQSSEIHCIDSSFLHLAEALNVTGKKVYHKYARPNSTDFKYLKGWEVIE